MDKVRGGVLIVDPDQVIESESSCGDDDTLKGSPCSSNNMFTASDTYHTDGDDESDMDAIHTSPLRPRHNHVYSRHLKKVKEVREDRYDDDYDDDLDDDILGNSFKLPEPHFDTGVDLLQVPRKALDQAEELAKRVWEAGWTVVNHNSLPKWLRDNDFLLKGHRPPLNSFWACFKSIFRIHTETGNIWTHLLGFIAFIGVATYFLTRPSVEIQWQEKAVFSAYFAGAILCMGFSWIFHTVYCHSEKVGRFFNKLDYCGIALLTMGSFVPWLYYSFYCRIEPKIAYIVLIFILGTACIIVSMWDKFAEPKFRPVRAGMFIGLGLSGVIPAVHYIVTDGFYDAINVAALGWLLLMAFLYIAGAVIYAVRIPERIWPGKFDIWFQSHQIFHVFVIAAAFVHYHGISEIANYRLTFGDCLEPQVS